MASNIEDLKLGLPQSELIQNTKAHIDALYDQNSEQATSISNAQKKADDAYLLASRKHKIVVYDTLDAMISALNSATATKFDIGDAIYIKDASYTRDFWVSAKQDTKYTNQTNESGFKADNFEKGYVGYFELSILDETPDVTNMVTSDENITDSKIVLGAGNKKVKGSSYLITTTLDNSDSKVPTSKAVSSAIDTKINSIEKYTLPIASETTLGGVKVGENLSVDANGVLSVTIKSDEIGKVKDVQVNGETVVDENTGIANIVINVADLKGSYVDVTPTANAITVNDTPYNAIIVENDTDITLELLNSSGEAVVTQIVRKDNKLYYCLPSGDTKTYKLRKVSGNTVGNGGSTSQLEARVGILETNVKALESKSNLYLHKVKLTGAAYAQDKDDDGTAILYLSFYSKTKPTSIPENFVSFNSDAKIQLWTSINSYLLRGYVVVNEYHMPILDASTSYSSNIIEVNVITPADGATMPYNIQAISIDSYLFTTVQ